MEYTELIIFVYPNGILVNDNLVKWFYPTWEKFFHGFDPLDYFDKIRIVPVDKEYIWER